MSLSLTCVMFAVVAVYGGIWWYVCLTARDYLYPRSRHNQGVDDA